jgi:GalNAc-alpha-(1->4)-GalNAc-alpha-(1->3)-diNAcBac-PP-undecaprenol alpha-1,4-N-acetyl-D-galactosaminyltransferase
MRITLTIPSLLCGGAERAATNMASHWAKAGWIVTILTLNHGDQPRFYNLQPNVIHTDLPYHSDPSPVLSDQLLKLSLDEIMAGCSRNERRLISEESGRLERLRQAIIATQPDAVISLEKLTNIRVLLATLRLGMQVIVSERCDPGHRLPGHQGWEALRGRVYAAAAFLVALTQEVAAYYASTMGGRVRVIPNMALPPILTERPSNTNRESARILVAMGRFCPVKGFDSLLRAFALIAPGHPSWSLEIWGDGPLRPDLEGLARELGIEERVKFPGFTRRPCNVLSRADLFVMSSDFEGFPNVLLEAMACGLPAVSFDCPSGPHNIIRDGIDGVLVRPANAQALAAALDRLMADDVERRRLAARAPDVIERFSPDKIMRMWECLVQTPTCSAMYS